MGETKQGEASSAPAATQASGSGGKALGTVAALLAIAAIAATGYVWTEVQKLRGLPDELQAGVGQTAQVRAELLARFDELTQRLDTQGAAVADLEARLSADANALAELASRLAQISQQVDTIAGTDRARRNRFLKAEALYYLRVANARAMLAGDARVAAQALALADAKLRETDDPAVATVRAQISEDIAALQAIPEIDLDGAAFRLQSLAAQAGSWPLRNPAPGTFRPGLDDGTKSAQVQAAGADNESPGDAWARFRAAIREVFDSIVRVRDNAERPEVQLTNAEYALALESIRAEIQIARIALVTGEFGLYASSLERIGELIRGYFDTDSTAVRAALDTLEELSAVQRPAGLPDISGSLALLLEHVDGKT